MKKHSFSTASPASLGVSPAGLQTFLEEIDRRHLGVHGFVLLRRGITIAEGWWKPYRAELPHQLFSLSKSFTSTAIGFAVQEGLLRLDDRVVSFFPEKLPCRPCENMEKMQIRHLLTMSTGHSVEPDIFHPGKLAAEFLRSYVDLEPGSRFLYNTAATYMLSAILQKRTGETLTRYLTPRLFRPLGIPVPQWDSDPDGVNLGGFGLNLDTRSIARFGQFLLQKGCWNGRQLLNPEWIQEATSFQVENFGEKDWGQGYGYQFWRCVPEGVYRGDGACGQYCVVCPRQEMVLAVNSGSDDMQAILDLFWEYVLPTVQEDPLPPDPSQQRKLEKKLAGLRLPTPRNTSEEQPQYAGRYVFPENPAGLRAVVLDFGGQPAVRFQFHRNWIEIPFGYGEWIETGGLPAPNAPNFEDDWIFFRDAAAAGGWKKDGLHLDIVHTRTLFTDHYHFQLTEGGLKLTIQRSLIGKKGAFELFGFREEDHD